MMVIADVADSIRKVPDVDWLRHARVEAGSLKAHLLALERVSRQSDDRDVGRQRVRPEKRER
jgi:hypothetical protein